MTRNDKSPLLGPIALVCRILFYAVCAFVVIILVKSSACFDNVRTSLINRHKRLVVSQRAPLLTVLMLAPDQRVLGGITSFIETLTRNLPIYCKVIPFTVGSMKIVAAGGGHSEDAPRLIWRVLTTPLKVAFLAYRARVDVVH